MWYADKIKYAEERLEQGEQPFDVDSHEVQKALNKYANAYLIKYQMTNHDAHQGLPTSILSVDEHSCVIHHLMQKKFQHWKDLGISWNMCQATFIHQDTWHQLCLPHLCADYAHAPIEEGPNKTMLSIILMSGTHNDESANNHTNQPHTTNQRTPKEYKKRVVGVYRHRSVLQCTTGFVAMSLIVWLHHANDLSFILIQFPPEMDENWVRDG